MNRRFKEWLLNEMPQARIDTPTPKQKFALSFVDIRAEDWEIDPNDPRAAEAEEIRRAIMRLPRPNFYGQIPGDNRYLTYEDDTGSFAILNFTLPNSICLDDLPLKRSWWDYIIAVDNEGNMVKEPARPRRGEVPSPRPEPVYVPVRRRRDR